MNPLFNYLALWAQLNPNLCRSGYHLNHYVKINGIDHLAVIADHPPRVVNESLAIVHAAVLNAINAPDSGLRLKVENDGQKWNVVVTSVDIPGQFSSANAEVSLATIEAYLKCLSAKAEAKEVA